MKKILFCLFIAIGLNGCASVVVGSGSTIALSTVQERTFDDAVDDTIIKAKINHAWFKEDLEMYGYCSMTVSEGRVLLTGVVKNEDQMLTAVRLTWQVEGVKEVINEIIINPVGKTLVQSSKDTWIATKLRTKLLAAKNIFSINYSIDVDEGNVYLIGIAQDEKELNKVIDIVRNTTSVESVVSYIKIKDPE
jgi:osmotically-inducible protein OsmY